MAKINVVFTGSFLQIKDEPITIDYFRAKLTSTVYNDTIDKGGVTYNVSFLDNFLKIDYSYGRSLPRPENVINITTGNAEANPRNPDQYEPKQHFALIDCATGLLWLSNVRKQNLILAFLKKNLNEAKIYIKNVYNEQEFLSQIKLLDEVRFSAVPNLFSTSNTLAQALAQEINGYGGSVAMLTIKYDEPVAIAKIISKITSVFNNKESFRNIFISGRDERNLGMLFNQSAFSRKIEFKTDVDENENYNSEEVFRVLIAKIIDENN